MTKVRSSLCMVIGIIACFLIEAQGVDKYTDENRPYEFGFTIDGEQHRHEKKDKNGIIQGEFGFITADGVYHVTVYATDEQGRFKIISMKNIRVKPYPTGPARQGHSLSFPSSPSTSTANAITPAKTLAPPHEQSPIMPATPQIKLKPVKIEPPAKSCSHCSLPTTTTQAPPLLSPSYNKAPGIISDQHGIVPVSNYPGQETSVPSNVGGLSGFGPSQQNNINYPRTNVEKSPANNQLSNYPGSSQNYPGSPQSYPEQHNVGQAPATRLSQINPDQQYAQGSPQEGNYPSNQNNLGQYGGMNAISPQSHVQGPSNSLSTSQVYPQDNTESHYNPQNAVGFTGQKELAPQYPTQNTESQPKNLQRNQYGERIPKQFNPNEQSGFPGLDEAIKSQPDVNEPPPREPKLIAAQMQIVDKNTDVRAKRPGEQEGLPQGLNKSNMEQLLYTFNYTLGFHGHFEEGYRNGAKQGYYFVTGRNGVRTRVDYVADDTGFHPKISQEVFEVSSDDVPKPETERDEKYGLRGYEFKWLYYPVGS